MHWIALLPPEAERTAWGWRALQFTPRVAQVDEALVLEVSGSHRLWGGADRLLRRLFRPKQAAALVEYAQAATYLIAIALLRLQLRGQSVPAQVPHDLPLSVLFGKPPKMTRDVRLANNYFEALFQSRQIDKVTKLLNALVGSQNGQVKQFANEKLKLVAQFLQQQQAQLNAIQKRS